MGVILRLFAPILVLGAHSALLWYPPLAPDGVPGMDFMILGVDLGQLWEAYGVLLTQFWVSMAHLLAHVSGVLFMDAF